MVIIGIIFLTNVGPHIHEDTRVCVEEPGFVEKALNFFNGLLYLSLNLFMTMIFWTFRNLHCDLLPSIKMQMRYNLSVMPIIFFTTVLASLISILLISYLGLGTITSNFVIE